MQLLVIVIAILVAIGAGAWLLWNFSDYVINAWNWVVEAFNALVSTVPGWAFVAFAAAIFLAFLAILVRVL